MTLTPTTPRHLRAGLILVAFASTAVACGDVDGTPDLMVLDWAEETMIYGTAATDAKYDAVGAMLMVVARNPDGSAQVQPFCSGTLIEPRFFLTASHCIAAGFTAANGYIFFGSQIRSPLSSYGTVVGVRSVQMHPQYDPESVTNDIALVELTEAPAGVQPIPRLTSALKMSMSDIGSRVRFLGFGVTEEQPNAMTGREYAYGNIYQLCLNAGGCGGNVAPNPYAFIYDHASGGPCHGDSGGPALITRGTTEYVAALTSTGIGGSDTCLDTLYGMETLIDPYETSFVKPFIDARDPCKALTCDPLAGCVDSGGGSASCGACPAGTTDTNGNGSRCDDVDECALGTDTCSADATCTNTAGSFTCACKAGFSGNGTTCADIDECAAGTAGCTAGQSCTNLPGTFTCTDPEETPEGGSTSGGGDTTTAAAQTATSNACGSDCALVGTSCQAVPTPMVAGFVVALVLVQSLRSRRRTTGR